jgi:hypothetical protein
MTSRRPYGAAVAAAAIATLAFPGAAGATAGKRSFDQSFPVASRLCANVAKGAGPARLRKSAGQVLADCGALQSSFAADRAGVLAVNASLAAQAAAARSGLAVACTGTPKHRLPCQKAHNKDRRILSQLSRQRVKAAHVYYSSIEAARVSFWSAIRALPGGASLREDSRIPLQDS